MFCVECGKEEKLYEHLCKECFLKKTKFFKLPNILKTTLCPTCSAWLKANHWEVAASDDDAIQSSIRNVIEPDNRLKNVDYLMDFQLIKTNILDVKIRAQAEFEDLDVAEDMNIEVRINYNTCPRCSRRMGDYFEAIIQVRANDRPMEDTELARAKKIVETMFLLAEKRELEYRHQDTAYVEENAFLSKIEYIHGGVDFYIGSSNISRQLARELQKHFNAKLKESSSLVGRRDGRDVYRTTILIRLPEYRDGDFIKLDNRVYLIKKIHFKTVTVQELKTGEKIKLEHQKLEDCSILGNKDLVFDAVLVLDSAKEVQVLDPENYRTVDLLKPKGYRITGDTVKIFKHQDTIILIPN